MSYNSPLLKYTRGLCIAFFVCFTCLCSLSQVHGQNTRGFDGNDPAWIEYATGLQTASSARNEPVLGRWRASKGDIIEFNTDGTVTGRGDGTWVKLDNTGSVFNLYRVNLNKGQSIFVLELPQDAPNKGWAYWNEKSFTSRDKHWVWMRAIENN